MAPMALARRANVLVITGGFLLRLPANINGDR